MPSSGNPLIRPFLFPLNRTFRSSAGQSRELYPRSCVWRTWPPDVLRNSNDGEPIVPADAGSASGLFSVAIGPARLHSALSVEVTNALYRIPRSQIADRGPPGT